MPIGQMTTLHWVVWRSSINARDQLSSDKYIKVVLHHSTRCTMAHKHVDSPRSTDQLIDVDIVSGVHGRYVQLEQTRMYAYLHLGHRRMKLSVG